MYRVTRFFLLVDFAVATGPRLAAGQTPRDSAQRLFVQTMKNAAVPAGQLAVLTPDRTLLTLTYGTWDSAGTRPVTDTTLFRVGSISKLYTATAAALLWHAGKFDIDSPVDKLVPEFVAGGGRVSPRLLAGHLGGVRHYLGKDFVRPPRHYNSAIEALEIFATDSLANVPGTTYLYSSYGYNLLGVAAGRAAGADYRQLVRSLVTGPMGLQRTHPQRSDSVTGEVAWAATLGSDGVARWSEHPDLSDRWPSGGFLSTAEEVARLGLRVSSDALPAEVRALLFTPSRLAGKSTGVGFGWRVGKDAAGRTVYHHGGNSDGGRAMLMVWPEAGIAVAMTSNLTSARFGEAEAMAIGAVFLTP